MVTDGDYQSSGEKLKSDSTFPGDSSAYQPADTSIDTSDRTTGENIPNSAARHREDPPIAVQLKILQAVLNSLDFG